MSILRLLARLDLDKSDFDKNLNAANDRVTKFGNDFTKSLAKHFGGGAAVALITTGIRALVNDAIEASKEIDAIGEKLGATAQEASRLRLAEKLGLHEADVGGFLSMSDNDLENLRAASRLMTLIKESGIRLATAWLSVDFRGLALTAARLFGLGKQGPGESDAQQLVRQAEATRQAHMAEMEDAVQLERQAGLLEGRAKTARLTDPQRLQQLLKYRKTLEGNLGGELTEEDKINNAHGIAEMKLALAQTNEQIAQLQRPMSQIVPMQGGSLGAIGAFTGAAGLEQIAQGQERVLNRLGDIHHDLTSSGIILRGGPRR